jgi:hypothetical protein
MMKDVKAGRPGGLSSQATEPQASPPCRASIPDAWRFLADGEINVPDGSLVYALGSYGDVFGPLPPEMFHPDAWAGLMLHASHDLIAVAICEMDWRDAFPLDTQAIEARRAETGTGSVHESAVGNADAPKAGRP